MHLPGDVCVMLALPTLAEVHRLAVAVQEHMNRHEIECSRRWDASRRGFDDLAAQVERISKQIRAGQLLLVKGALWIIALLAAGLAGTSLYIFNHLSFLLGR